MFRYLLTAHKGKVIAGALAAAALITFGVLGFVLPGGHPGTHVATSLPSTGSEAPVSQRADGQGYNVLSSRERSMLDTAPNVTPAFTPLLPPIPAGDRAQPDLYARAFLTALFTHPYAGVTRAQMLAWVQAQQAVSPFVTGGTPAELNRLLIESATDPAWSNSGYAPLPRDAGWARAAAGHAVVRIDRITCVTPPDWETAISAGDITDPGLTARQVSADMTMTWTDAGVRKRQQFSAALTLLLEGPPTAGQFGAVVIADTSVVQAATS